MVRRNGSLPNLSELPLSPGRFKLKECRLLQEKILKNEADEAPIDADLPPKVLSLAELRLLPGNSLTDPKNKFHFVRSIEPAEYTLERRIRIA
jgi:hypothetical protein